MDDERFVAYMGGEPPERSRILLFTPEEIAEHLRVTRRTVYRWLTEGKLQGQKAGKQWRISEVALGRFLNDQGYCFTPEAMAAELEEKGLRERGQE